MTWRTRSFGPTVRQPPRAVAERGDGRLLFANCAIGAEQPRPERRSRSGSGSALVRILLPRQVVLYSADLTLGQGQRVININERLEQRTNRLIVPMAMSRAPKSTLLQGGQCFAELPQCFGFLFLSSAGGAGLQMDFVPQRGELGQERMQIDALVLGPADRAEAPVATSGSRPGRSRCARDSGFQHDRQHFLERHPAARPPT